MRLKNIEELKNKFSGIVQVLPNERGSDDSYYPFKIYKKEAFKRALGRAVSLPILKFLQKKIKKNSKCFFSFKYDILCVGQRFGNAASLSLFLNFLKKSAARRILVCGCGLGGEDVQFWLRQGFQVEGVDIVSDVRWPAILAKLRQSFTAEIHFRQGSLENLPYKNSVVDAVVSEATLEHVRNLNFTLDEIARVLKPGGYARHAFGPLYFSHGGDHCIGTYGFKNGYAHLIESEETYRRMISDIGYFEKHSTDKYCNGWAMMDQFSFLKPREYFSIFEKKFSVVHTLLLISEEAIRFRALFPDKWAQMLTAGIEEEALLIMGIDVILQRKPDDLDVDIAPRPDDSKRDTLV